MPRTERPLRFRTHDGLTLTGSVLEAAEGSEPGPPLLLSPGNGFPVQAYEPALRALPADVSVHALNPRGHGGSDVPAEASWDAMLEDLQAYVTSLGGEPVWLAGHSMGAMLSLRLAAEAPALVLGLLLMEPPLPMLRGEPLSEDVRHWHAAFIERARTRRDGWESRADAANWFADSIGYRLWDPAARSAFVAHGLVDAEQGAARLATPAWLEAGIYEGVPREALYAWADATRCAAVLYRGLDSMAVNIAAFDQLTEAFPLSASFCVPGTHTFPMEHPAETGRLLAHGLRLLRGETGLAAIDLAVPRDASANKA